MTAVDAPRDEDFAVVERAARLPLAFPAPLVWWGAFAGAVLLIGLFLFAVGVLFWRGVGVFGNNIPVAWGFPIINYIWFLGIGHAGTLISALLLLTGTTRRNALNRFSESMTLCAVICAGLWPILHLGRPWLFYWTAPYPNTMGIWPNFLSPLSWDFFAVLIYLTVSAVFWYIGALPDIARLRDQASARPAQILYGLAALGWRGSAYHWARWQQAYRLTAALAVPLVFGVTASYALLLAAGPIPGWNSPIFPPYFLFGAVFSGFAVVAMIAAIVRRAFAFQALITERHLDLIAKLMLATGLMTAYGYVSEAFIALYSGEAHEVNTLLDRVSGVYAPVYWGAILFNFLPLQLLWSAKVRRQPWLLAAIGLSVTIGMWLERFMLVVTGLYRDYLVSSWHVFSPSLWDWLLFLGMFGVFLAPFLLLARVLPIVAAFEVLRQRWKRSGEARHA